MICSAVSSVVFQRPLAANLEYSIGDTMTSSLSVRPDASRSTPATSLRVSPCHHVSWVIEEESTNSNSVASDSPPLPPRSSKLSTSSVSDGDKWNSPPEIPRRLSMPNSRLPQARTVHTYSMAPAPRELSEVGQQPQQRSAVSNVSDLLTEVGDDVPPPLLPRQPISQMKRRDRVKVKPVRNPNVTDSREASETTSLSPAQVSLAVGQPDVDSARGSALDRIPPEAQIKSAAPVPEASDPGDSGSVPDRIPPNVRARSASAVPASSDPDDSGSVPDSIPSEAVVKSATTLPPGSDGVDEDPEDAFTLWRPVSEIKRDIDARAAAANGAPAADARLSVPSRKLVIPAAFQNSTVQ